MALIQLKKPISQHLLRFITKLKDKRVREIKLPSLFILKVKKMQLLGSVGFQLINITRLIKKKN